MRENHIVNMALIEEIILSNDRRILSLTPCAGRCSTVFGDAVCRGCRRFNHEVIQWNTYTSEQRMIIWQRLDVQLDQILVPMLPHANIIHVEAFIESKRVRVFDTATTGRKLYHALKICEKNKNLAEVSGLGIQSSQVKQIWAEFERRVLALATASYELAWLRANGISYSLLQRTDETF